MNATFLQIRRFPIFRNERGLLRPRTARRAKIGAPRRRSRKCDQEVEGNEMSRHRRKAPSCEDCFFERKGLCALREKRPCPTFRPAERGLVPDPQLTFAFRFGWEDLDAEGNAGEQQVALSPCRVS